MKIFTIATNTFVEVIRQPIFFIVLGCGLFLILLSPYFTLFALMENNKIVKDMGLATVLLTGLFLSAFSSSSVIYQEIENKTILTIISKPVARWSFILGKYIGIMFSLFLAQYILSLVFIHIIRTEISEAAYSKSDYPVILGYLFATIFSLLMGAFWNFFYQRPFISSAVLSALAIFTLTFLGLCLIGPKWELQPFFTNLDSSVLLASLLVFLATSLLTAFALACSTRLSSFPTMALCLLVFLAGLFSDYLLGRHIEISSFARFLYAIIPNLQIYWVMDAILEERKIPITYIVLTGIYTFVFIVGILSLAMALFQEKETE
ncbi:MAG: hypothetical protein HUU50_10560 [Candidatus Brocadiae bacterium]|nr:hypothetical protein [Candidatus Brocadiia bacterium]